MDDSCGSHPMALTCLDNIEFWTPPATEGVECASPAKQRYSPSFTALPDLSSFPTDRGLSNPPSTVHGQTLDRPISIPSDVESDIDTTDGSDAEQDDGGQSDSSLASMSTLLAQAKSRWGNVTSRASLDPLFEAPDSMHPPSPPTHGQPSEKTRIDGGTLPWLSSRSSAVPSIPQGHDAGQSCESRSRSSPGSDGLDCSDDAAPASSSHAKTPEACSPLSSSSSARQGQGTEMATGTPCETEAVSPKHATGTSRRRSARPRRTCQRRVGSIGGYATSNLDTTADSNSDDDPSASTGSHDKTRSDDESYPSPGRGEGEQGAGSGVDEADDESDSPPPKRRKPSQAPTSTRRKHGRAALSVGTDVANSPARAGTSRSARGVPSPPSSHYSSRSSPPSHTGAKFQEWFLPNAKLKRITFGGGRTTFQLQFDWDPHVDGRRADSPSSNGLRAPTSRKGVRPRGDAASSTAYTREEDEFIIKLKEDGRSWATIHRDFNDEFPVQRTKGSLQVRYCTKLKDRTTS